MGANLQGCGAYCLEELGIEPVAFETLFAKGCAHLLEGRPLVCHYFLALEVCEAVALHLKPWRLLALGP